MVSLLCELIVYNAQTIMVYHSEDIAKFFKMISIWQERVKLINSLLLFLEH